MSAPQPSASHAKAAQPLPYPIARLVSCLLLPPAAIMHPHAYPCPASLLPPPPPSLRRFEGKAVAGPGPGSELDGYMEGARDAVFQKGQSRRIWGELYKVLDSSDVVVEVS